jgi:hypothetical protein
VNAPSVTGFTENRLAAFFRPQKYPPAAILTTQAIAAQQGNIADA